MATRTSREPLSPRKSDAPRRVRADQRQRSVEQLPILRLVQPRRSSRWMWQYHDVEFVICAARAMFFADDAGQLRFSDQHLRGERPDGDHKLRFQQTDFAIEMRSAVRDL